MQSGLSSAFAPAIERRLVYRPPNKVSSGKSSKKSHIKQKRKKYSTSKSKPAPPTHKQKKKKKCGKHKRARKSKPTSSKLKALF
jgi:hypothetical protein